MITLTGARGRHDWSHSMSIVGGCLCGAIRYEIHAVFDAGYCHCSRCRKGTGGAVLAWAHINGGDFNLVKGKPGRYRSSDAGDRCFCPICGSPLYFEGRNAAYYSVNLGTLDDPDAIRPQIHMCIESKLPWLAISDDLPRVEGNTLPHPDKRAKALAP